MTDQYDVTDVQKEWYGYGFDDGHAAANVHRYKRLAWAIPLMLVGAFILVLLWTGGWVPIAYSLGFEPMGPLG